MNVLIVVTHLLGTGHLRRAVTLGNAIKEKGHHVTLASGGTQVAGLKTDGLNFVQLPPLKSDGTNFTTLLTDAGVPADETYLDARKATLLDCLARPMDVIITELFPFGRRVLTNEFTALLEHAANLDQPPKILCSIRDIIAPPSKPTKVARADDIIDQYYDGVLVHSDEAAIPLDASWPVSDTLRPKLHYTGFVTQSVPAAHPTQAGLNEVLVSAGGGAVGGPLFKIALKAAELTPEIRWHILVGGTEPDPLIVTLSETAPANVILEPARPDFREMLNHAICSVSMVGYNTAMDILQTGIPALLIPFDEGGEVEQSLRAQSLGALPAVEVLSSATVTPSDIAEAVGRLSRAGRRTKTFIAMDGAAESVRITEAIAEHQ